MKYLKDCKGSSIKWNMTLERLRYSELSSKNKVDEVHSDTASWLPGKEDHPEFPVPAKGIIKELFPII